MKTNTKGTSDWGIVQFPVALRLWFAAWCKGQGITIAKGLEKILTELRNKEEKK